MAHLAAPTPAPLGSAVPFSDPPLPPLPHPIPGVSAAPRVVYTDSHVRLTNETLVLKKLLPLHTRYMDLDEVRSIYPATELPEQTWVVGSKMGGVVWAMDLKNLRLSAFPLVARAEELMRSAVVNFGKGKEKRRMSIMIETKGFLRRVGFSVEDPQGL